jgi:outer membrane protein OmpA-like peptidoglycan-associated protein
MIRLLTSVVLALCLCTPAQAQKVDPEMERLRAQLRSLDEEPTLGGLAPAQRLRAQQAIEALSSASRRERPDMLLVAERRLDIARAAAESEAWQQQIAQLERERDQILLEASRRDAEAARLEAEKLRLQSLARAEETERAQEAAASAIALSELSTAEAEQAKRLAEAQSQEAALARREADLAFAAADSLRLQLQTMTATSEARGQVMTLSGEAFASGQSRLKPEARANLQRVVEFVGRFPDKNVLIEGHTDSQGGVNLNQVLSQKRAEAVRDALVQDGVDGARLTAVGLGKDRPVADNGSAEGRARNRRVEIIVLDAR